MWWGEGQSGFRIIALLPVPGEQSDQPPGEQGTRRRNRERGEEQISRYREILKGLQQRESQQRADKEMEMEVSWVPGR